jgi:beta-xylosidase
MNVAFFSDSTGNSGKHRVGWAMSTAQSHLPGSWNVYSKTYLDLGQSSAGEIDQHIFLDEDGKTYLLWKTDDNSIGSRTTRLWGQEVRIVSGSVSLVGSKKELMDSSGLWWVDSWISGGSLVEGPELIHIQGGYYYLFFAAGKYCQASYSEGVARSKSIWGPYEKMPVPLLSTGLTQNTGGKKQIGPGHASFLISKQNRYFAVYHASPGNNCNRHAFVEEMLFDPVTMWPYINFGAQ